MLKIHLKFSYILKFLILVTFVPKVFCSSCEEDAFGVTCNTIADLLQFPRPAEQRIVNVRGLDDSVIEDFICDEPKFRNFSSVTKLWLSNVRLRRITDKCLKGLDKIEQIDLGVNSLTAINMSVFRASPAMKIQHIFMRNNRILEIDFANEQFEALEGLYLTNNGLRTIQITSKILPKVNHLVIDVNLISSFKIESQTLYSLDMSYNRIQSFQGSDLVAPALMVFFLQNNLLTTLSPEMLINLPILHVTYLSENSLTKVSFPKLKHLNWLDLERNAIKSLNDVNVTAVEQISNLNLNSNDIRQLNDDGFIFRNLTQFSCDFCSIQSIDPHFFANNMRHLNRLSLASNNLTSSDIFKGEKTFELTNIDLSNNDIRAIGGGDFDRLTKLTHILLDNNKISEIDEGAFNATNEIQFVSLINNTLFQLPENLFEATPLLRTLQLSGNYLSYLPLHESNSKTFSKLEEFLIDRNPLQCKCVELIKSWTERNNISLTINNENMTNGNHSICINNEQGCQKDVGREFVYGNILKNEEDKND
ncbi:slit homolog 2 protein-like [Lutzomyia longipalpis]|uniref:slit homolog 2 protein-like n=1 Tax=Lutzomyia longipalpis TaxID=7200 RepID=UPI00248450ED|nr:slit homolog 2 protein-like [Lutzomyia longipalpis]